MERIFVITPLYDNFLHCATHYCLNNAVHRSGTCRVVGTKMFSSSLLPRTFNELWITAWLHRQKIDWVAMMHADIDAGPGWAENLVHEAIRLDATLLSANVRIKDTLGDTSTAMDLLPPPDTAWGRKLRRIAVADLMRLPISFTNHDVARLWGLKQGEYGALLINTGCWVARLHDGWANKVSFHIHSGIDWDQDPPKCWTDSEDWELGRDLHHLGYGDRVFASSLLNVHHWGQISFNTWPTNWTSDTWLQRDLTSEALRPPVRPPEDSLFSLERERIKQSLNCAAQKIRENTTAPDHPLIIYTEPESSEQPADQNHYAADQDQDDPIGNEPCSDKREEGHAQPSDDDRSGEDE